MKIHNLSLENFRGFDQFKLKNLGRVNLLVGTNNCGKTTVLEAVNILMANGDFSTIGSTLFRRGETISSDDRVNADLQGEVRRLFHGHQIEVGTSFRLSADTELGSRTLVVRIEEFDPPELQLFSEPQVVESFDEFLPPRSLSLRWTHEAGKGLKIPISGRGGIFGLAIQRMPARFGFNKGGQIRFVTASSLTAGAVARLFDEIVLSPEEDLVTEALRIIEPNIERIASVAADRLRGGMPFSPHGGILVRLKGLKDRVPIGSMGNGIWRMLGLALEVIASQNGILLIDDIDTGLHHTVMKEMWHFLFTCSKRYKVQIIATSHSWDCYHSLAVICRDDVSEGSDVTISRIERGRAKAVSYSEQEIVAAADRDIEVR